MHAENTVRWNLAEQRKLVTNSWLQWISAAASQHVRLEAQRSENLHATATQQNDAYTKQVL